MLWQLITLKDRKPGFMVIRFESRHRAYNSFEGWGLTTSDKLLEVEVPVVSNVVCQAAMDANVSFNISYSLASSS